MKILYYITLIVCSCHVSFGQAKFDYESIFKMNIFLNQSTDEYSKQMFIKNDSVFNNFSKAVSFKLDTLKIERNDNYFFNQFKFLELKLFDKQKGVFTQNVIHNRTVTESQFLIGVGKGNHYVIALDERTGKLAGFETNDFIGLVNDFFEYEKSAMTKKNIQKLFKSLKVENLDFECIYNWFQSNYKNRSNFPCMDKVNDILWIG
jgi:hypothetical protein